MKEPQWLFSSAADLTAGLAAGKHNPTDGFARLPLEIKETIAAFLPMSDALNARLASRSMGAVYFSASFWKTRFEVNGERGVFNYFVREDSGGRVEEAEAEGEGKGKGNGRDEGKRQINWRLLYHVTNQLRCDRSFDDTLKVWEVIRWVRDATLAVMNRKQQQQHRAMNPAPAGEERPLEFVGRSLQHYHGTRWPGTRVESIEVPPSLTAIGVSVQGMSGPWGRPETIVITGLEFIGAESESESENENSKKPNAMLGSTAAGAEVMKEADDRAQEYYLENLLRPERRPTAYYIDSGISYGYPGVHILMDAKSFRGFSISQGSLEVYRLQVLRDGGSSKTVGCTWTRSEGVRMDMDEVRVVVGVFEASERQDACCCFLVLGLTKDSLANWCIWASKELEIATSLWRSGLIGRILNMLIKGMEKSLAKRMVNSSSCCLAS